MAEWAGLGYYARARNLLKCARAVAALGAFPDTRAGLQELPGIGPYTSAAIAAIAFDRAKPWSMAMSSASWRGSLMTIRPCPPPNPC